MPNKEPTLDQTFSALSDPTRLAVVQALSHGSRTVSELAAPFDMALPSFTQHLGVLEKAGLVVSRREGRTKVCSLDPHALEAAETWLARSRREWEARMDRFEAHLAKVTKERPND